MSTKTISAPWLLMVTWNELITLIICLALDLIDYAIPLLMTPVFGDLLDFGGFVFCAFYFSWASIIALIELIPGLDVIPFFTITWLVWYGYRRRNLKTIIESELEKWR